MKKLYILFVLVFFYVEIAFSQVAIEWQKSYGGSTYDEGQSIKLTNDGGFIIAGWTTSNDGDITNNHGGYDYWVIKLDNSGNMQWQKTYGGSGWDFGYSIDQTLDGGYIIAGQSESSDGDVSTNFGEYDYWIIKIDTAGNIQWEKNYGGSYDDHARSIIQTIDGGYIVAGRSESFDGDVSGNINGQDYWVVKLNSSGILEWEKSYGGTGQEEAKEIIENNDGSYTLVGSTLSYDFDVTNHHGGKDYWVINIDSIGNLKWAKCLGGTEWDEGCDIQKTTDGGYIVVGQSESDDGDVTINKGWDDCWIVKLDSLGSIQWQKSFGGSLDDRAYSVLVLSDGGFIILCAVNSEDGDINFNHGGTDIWAIKLDSIGNYVWQRSLGGTSAELVNTILNVDDNNLIFGGMSLSTNCDLTNNNGLSDLWVVKLTTDYNIISGNSFLDLNGNFTKDAGEANIVNHKVTESSTGRIAFTNNLGNYYLNILDSGNYSVGTNLLPYYVPAPSVHNILFTNVNQSDSLNDFAFLPIGVYNDLKVDLIPISSFTPGFEAHYIINYKNIGTTLTSGTLVFYPDTNLIFDSSFPSPDIVTADSIVWNIPVLNSYDEENVIVNLNVNLNLLLGSTIASYVQIESVSVDADPSNNQSQNLSIVTGSFDPNDILVNLVSIPVNQLSNSPYLEYLIRFQNTGTDTAFNVKVLNNITDQLNNLTFELINSSHPLQIQYYDHSRLMEFKFDNIFLPDSNINELLSHGFIRFRINPITSLNVGDSILNSAAIYFDFNAPVITNTAVTEIVLPISIPEVNDNFNFSLFPNPTTGELNASFTLRDDAIVKLQVFNNLGQSVKFIPDKKMKPGNNKITFSTENIQPGIYYLQLLIDGEAITKKLVKM